MNIYDTRGGARSGSGRKPIPDKKVQTFAMVRESIVELLGEDEVKKLMAEAVVWNGQLEDMKIQLDADMKVAKYTINDGDINLAELQWESGKMFFVHDGRRYWISQFGRISP